MVVERFGGGRGTTHPLPDSVAPHNARAVSTVPTTKSDYRSDKQASLIMLVVFGNPNLDTYLLVAPQPQSDRAQG